MSKINYIFNQLPKEFFNNPTYVLEKITNKIKEKLYGIETTKYVPVDELNIPLNLEPVWHESSGNVFLRNVLKKMNISENDTIIDLGCGKGGALISMAKFPFKKLIGIEYSNSIFLIAKNNIKKTYAERIEITQGDAGDFKSYDEVNYIYMFNPFGITTMEKVLQNIGESLRKNPRELKIIYLNPLLHKEIIKTGLFNKVDEFDYGIYNKFFVYKSLI